MSEQDDERRSVDRELARYRALVHEQLEVAAVYRVSADGRRLLQVEGGGVLPHLPGDQPTGWVDAYVHPEDRPAVRRAWDDALRTAQPFALEHRARRADGGWLWVSSRVAPVRNEAGVLVEWIGQANDVSARREYEQTLLRREKQFSALLDAAANSIFRMSADGSELRQVQGRGFLPDAQEALPEWAWLAGSIPREDRDRVKAAVDAALASGQIFDLEHQVYRVDGSVGWAHSRSVPVRDDSGVIVEWFGAVSDITERKQAEKALQELTESLEARVERRTAEVRDLSRRLTLAEQEERRRIAQILHDDLQQLLYGVQLKMSMIQRALEAAPQPELTRKVEESEAWLEQAIDITRQLSVDLSPPIFKSEGLADALRWLQGEIRRLHGLEVIVETDDSCRIADEGLRVLVFQIVRELLFNVNKHAGVDRAWVRLSLGRRRLIVEVADEGRGFDAEQLARGDRGGFGLTSVRERLSLVGGRLSVRSAPGRGTRARIEVPLRTH